MSLLIGWRIISLLRIQPRWREDMSPAETRGAMKRTLVLSVVLGACASVPATSAATTKACPVGSDKKVSQLKTANVSCSTGRKLALAYLKSPKTQPTGFRCKSKRSSAGDDVSYTCTGSGSKKVTWEKSHDGHFVGTTSQVDSSDMPLGFELFVVDNRIQRISASMREQEFPATGCSDNRTYYAAPKVLPRWTKQFTLNEMNGFAMTASFTGTFSGNSVSGTVSGVEDLAAVPPYFPGAHCTTGAVTYTATARNQQGSR